jgi:hypothetical protein
VPALRTYDYAVLRVVPRVDRGEFVNAGVMLSCAAERWLKAAVRLDPARVRAIDPTADLETIGKALSAIERVCAGDAAAGEIGRLPARQRFHWLAAPRSTIIQTSPVHTGQCEDLDAALAALVRRLVDPPG